MLVSVDPKVYVLIVSLFFVLTMLAAIKTSIILVFVLCLTSLMLGFAVFLAKWVLARDEGTPEMQEVRDMCFFLVSEDLYEVAKGEYLCALHDSEIPYWPQHKVKDLLRDPEFPSGLSVMEERLMPELRDL